MWRNYYQVSSVDEAIQILEQNPENTRIVAGATDLILEMERGVRRGIDTLVDVTRVPGLDRVTQDADGLLHVGPLVTHNACVASPLLRKAAFPLVNACWEVGSPQIRNRGTIAGNLITASPANDTISPLMALGASVRLRSAHSERIVPLAEFYTGVRRTVMQPNEMLVEILIPAMGANQRGGFIKFALRRAQAISLVNVSVVLSLQEGVVTQAALTLGAVAPTIIHAHQAEEFLLGKHLDEEVIHEAAELAMQAAHPITDVRSSANYRKIMVRVNTRRCLQAIADGTEQNGVPADPVLLMGKPGQPRPVLSKSTRHADGDLIETTINGKPVTFASGQDKTLLRLLREEGLLTGTKEGCAEGECGACTAFLDGQAVMSCMVPAPRAQGAEIVTIEGLAPDGQLHPVQQAFMDTGAVQCGYCTPGFIMSSAKLLEEKPTPSQEEIRQALTGNLCRCTGYYKIIEAVELASRRP